MSFEEIERELGNDVLNISTPPYIDNESSSDSSDISIHPRGCRCPSCKELPPTSPLNVKGAYLGFVGVLQKKNPTFVPLSKRHALKKLAKNDDPLLSYLVRTVYGWSQLAPESHKEVLLWTLYRVAHHMTEYDPEGKNTTKDLYNHLFSQWPECLAPKKSPLATPKIEPHPPALCLSPSTSPCSSQISSPSTHSPLMPPFANQIQYPSPLKRHLPHRLQDRLDAPLPPPLLSTPKRMGRCHQCGLLGHHWRVCRF